MKKFVKDYIHFFGTTGNTDIIFKKIRSAGGLYLNVDNTKIIIDPGINTFYKFLKYYGSRIDGIVLSHIHIDHSNDLNVFIEYMTESGKNKSGIVLLPSQAIEERILYPYLKNFPKEVNLLEENKKYTIGNIEIVTSISHRHGVENYGFVFKTKNHKIGLVTDTVYFPELLESYKGCNILIINVPYYKQDKAVPKHLDISNVEELIKNNHPEKVILTYFNCNILDKNPENIARDLAEKYSIEVISAYDDMIFLL